MDIFRGRTAVVTGGANGIGKALVRELVRQGANIVTCDVDTAALEQLRNDLGEVTGEIVIEDVDVSDRSAMLRFAERTHSHFGTVHALFNNAGVGGEWGRLFEVAQADFPWCMKINVNGVVNGIEAFVGRMVASGQACHVVNIASVSGILPNPGGGGYSPSKYAVVSLTEGLAVELADTQVAASVVCPGFVNTGFLASGRNLGNAPKPRIDDETLMKRRGHVRAMMQASMSPGLVVRKIMVGLERGDLYIFTHPEFRLRFEERVANIRAALDLAEQDARDMVEE